MTYLALTPLLHAHSLSLSIVSHFFGFLFKFVTDYKSNSDKFQSVFVAFLLFSVIMLNVLSVCHVFLVQLEKKATIGHREMSLDVEMRSNKQDNHKKTNDS